MYKKSAKLQTITVWGERGCGGKWGGGVGGGGAFEQLFSFSKKLQSKLNNSKIFGIM